MSLNELYLLAKALKATKGFFKKNVEVVYYLDIASHEEMQREVYGKIKNTMKGYVSQNQFEISIFDIKFILKK